MNSLILGAVVVAYVAVMLVVGYWCMKRTKDVGDFFLGGRTLGPWMSAFAFGTTYFSAVLFIGYAGKLGWGFGIHTMWIVIGNTLIGTVMSWWILAGRTRDMTVRLNAITMPEFLRARFDSKGLQVLSALAMFVFLAPYSASVYMGLSYLFEKALGMPYGTALIFLAALTGIYLVMGGYFAVAVSDFIRGIVEFAGVLLMVFLLAQWKGGFPATASQLISDPKMAPGLMAPAKLGMAHAPAFFQCVVPGSLILISLVLITSFGPWSLPQMVQKFYSIRSKADVKRAMIIAGVFSLFMAGGAYYTGALTHLYYAKGLPAAIMQNGKPNLDLLMPAFIMEHVPYWLVLIILLLVFSASMSSLSSLVLVSSSAIAVDIFGAFAGSRTVRIMRTAFWTLTAVLGLVAADQAARSAQAFIMSKVTSAAIVQMQGTGELFLPQAAQELYARAASLNQLAIGHLVGFAFAAGFAVYIFLWLRSPSEKLLGDVKLALMRILCAVFVAISLWIAMSKVDVIVNLMVMSWGSLAGVFMAPYIYGLFWKRTTRAGVYAGIITGLVSAFTLFWAWGSPGVPLAGAITMFLPMLVVPIVSLMTKPPKQEIIDIAFGVEKAAGEEWKAEATI